ncbi:hypothetical protein HNY73_016223 [Argiope bruennichi]|uniref:DUF5641 domain-containing protein n=1 Tax=Argiope bruennichi TaxID=94029 RepID=A0A8T0EI60_ARGBR|nr:hypothetical protein HNY73_016223 [Argiope bruennichi]
MMMKPQIQHWGRIFGELEWLPKSSTSWTSGLFLHFVLRILEIFDRFRELFDCLRSVWQSLHPLFGLRPKGMDRPPPPRKLPTTVASFHRKSALPENSIKEWERTGSSVENKNKPNILRDLLEFLRSEVESDKRLQLVRSGFDKDQEFQRIKPKDKIPTTACIVSNEKEREGLMPLTPACFLQGIPSSDTTDLDEISSKSLNRKLRFIQKLRHGLRTRFRNEYSVMLVHKDHHNREESLNVGDIFLLQTDGKRLHRPLGIVTEVFPGADGYSRVAKV